MLFCLAILGVALILKSPFLEELMAYQVCPDEPGALRQKLTAHLVTATGIACGLMFLVGLNTAVLNSVELVVFPGHTILEVIICSFLSFLLYSHFVFNNFV